MVNRINWRHAVVGIVLGIGSYNGYQLWNQDRASEEFNVGQMPPCESKPVRRLLTKTIGESPSALQTGLKLIQIGEVEDYANTRGQPATPVSLDPEQSLRFCKAYIFTNAGKGDIHFNLSWTDATKSGLWLQVTVVTF